VYLWPVNTFARKGWLRHANIAFGSVSGPQAIVSDRVINKVITHSSLVYVGFSYSPAFLVCAMRQRIFCMRSKYLHITRNPLPRTVNTQKPGKRKRGKYGENEGVHTLQVKSNLILLRRLATNYVLTHGQRLVTRLLGISRLVGREKITKKNPDC